jgi:MOSC domain-containing protein YiiM
MRITSTNTAQPTNIHWKGQDLVTGIYKKPRPEGIYLDLSGITGDTIGNPKAHGGALKACYLFSHEQYPYWEEQYPQLGWEYGMFGENLTVAGLDESRLWMGSIYRIGEALVRITTPREPCYKLGIRFADQGIIEKFHLRGYPGSYAQVLEAGTVRPGDAMELLEAPEQKVSISEFYHLLFFGPGDRGLVHKALSLDWLPESKRQQLLKGA